MLARFFKEEGGATAIEYGLIASLVSIAIITVLGLMGDQLEAVFTTIQTSLSTS